MNEEARKPLTVKVKPSLVKKVRMGAVITEKTLGKWLEEAIEEKVARGER